MHVFAIQGADRDPRLDDVLRRRTADFGNAEDPEAAVPGSDLPGRKRDRTQPVRPLALLIWTVRLWRTRYPVFCTCSTPSERSAGLVC